MMIETLKRLANGESVEAIEKEYNDLAKERSKEEGKAWGECEACGRVTCLVEVVSLCGPCCFGEAETENGNW